MKILNRLYLEEKYKNIDELENIDLSYQKINRIEYDTFYGLKNIKTLNLSNNEIDTLDPILFKDLFLLENIDLSNNKLNKIIPGILHGLPYIKNINLKNNKNLLLENFEKNNYLKNINFIL
jgi:Leucine-rich repeat (LRR) protein